MRPDRSNRWTVVLLMLSVAAGVHHATSISPFLNEIGDDFSVSDPAVGQIGTFTFGAAFVVALFIAPFITRFELRKLLWMSLLIVSTMGILTVWAPNYQLLLLVRAIAGIGGGLAWAGSFAAIGRAWPDVQERRSKQGFVVGALAGGPALLTPLLRVIGEQGTWETAVFAYSVFYLLVALLIFALLPALTGTTDSFTGPKRALKDSIGVVTIPSVGLALFLRVISGISISTLFIFLAGFMDDEYSNGQAWIGAAFGLPALGFMISSFLADRVMQVLGSLIRSVTVGTIVMIFTTTLLIWFTPHPAATSGLLFVWGVLVGLYFNGLVAMIFEEAGERQGTAIFVDGALGPLGTTFGAAFGGLAITLSGGYEGWKILITGVSLFLLIPLFALRRAIGDTS